MKIKRLNTFYKYTLIAIVFLLATSFSTKTQRVYVCDSEYASKYHLDPNCQGLNKCTHNIIETSLDSAKTYFGFGLCGFER